MIQSFSQNTKDGYGEWRQSQPFDFHGGGAGLKFLMKCDRANTASVQVDYDGAVAAAVVTVVVSNDPAGKIISNHPAAITLSGSATISEAFSVAGYLWFGVKLTTVNGAALSGQVYLNCKDCQA